MALCDLSTRNPNVLFELGLRQAFDKPVVLVQEVDTPRIFDISSIRCLDYRKERLYDEVLQDQENIAEAIIETFNKWKDGSSINSLVKLLSLTQPATLKDIKEVEHDPTFQIMMAEMSAIRQDIALLKRNTIDPHPVRVSRRDYEIGMERYGYLLE